MLSLEIEIEQVPVIRSYTHIIKIDLYIFALIYVD